ncbi:syntaxin-7-like [Branchiostoma floridae]|uniref:Syntaxin-7-like n=1 Tax=Branchiostoma floridae TaxID=7739 RepID=A0A9J7HX32_BRAFL|nr:syntaxin-7-like [Branchiostoma floridae]XP_035666396.1 syntaxin-7-like [Branchiostoma floridae]
MSRGEFGVYGSVESGGFDQRDGRYGAPRAAGYQGDGSNDVNRLCELTSTNIFTISNNASSLEKTLKQIGSANDSHQLRERVHNMQQQTNLLVSETARCLKQLSSMTRGAPKPQKLQVDRLSNEFKQSVQRYGIIQKRVAEQSRMSVDSIRSPSRASQGFLDDDYGDESTSLLEEEQQRRRVEELQRQEQVIDFEGDIIREREERIREIEADILDINEIFRDLGTMVHEQGEMIDTIEANVEKAYGNVESGNKQLEKASQYQKKARKKMCCLLVVLLVVGGIIALIVYLSVKK